MARISDRTLVSGFAAGLVVVLSSGLASAHAADPEGADPSACIAPLAFRHLLGDQACSTAGGLIRIHHGNGDTRYVAQPRSATPADALLEDASQRPVACASESDGPANGQPRHRQRHIAVYYAHPFDLPSRHEEKADAIRTYVERANHNLYSSSRASSDGAVGADLRVLCEDSGAIAVRHLASSTSRHEDSFSTIHAEIAPPAHEIAWVFYDDAANGACGVGHLRPDDRLTSRNANMWGGTTALVYGLREPDVFDLLPGGSVDGCWAGRTPLHELGHNLGAVQQGAPFSSGAHCEAFDDQDVMCYDDNGNGQVEEDCPRRSNTFDCGYDTYADAHPEAGEWLASHWNIFVNLRWVEFENPFLRWEYEAEELGG